MLRDTDNRSKKLTRWQRQPRTTVGATRGDNYMPEYNNLFCRIYVDSNTSSIEFASFLSACLDGDQEDWSVITPLLYIGVNESKDYISGGGDFLHYKLNLELDPRENVEQHVYINAVKELMLILHKNSYTAVASCDFEDELT